MEILNTIDKAVELNENYIKADDKSLFLEIDKQLKYIAECIKKTGDNSLIDSEKLTMGILAVREIKDWKPDLAKLIFSICDFAREGK